MRDIAASTPPGTRSLGLAISRNGQHVAGLLIPQAMAWSEAPGLEDLGTFGGSTSRSFDVNSKGEVVGSADTSAGRAHAFVWTVADGMVDLNDRLRDAPPGLELESAVAVSETGAIVAYSNLGLMLLKPDGDLEEESTEATQESASLALPYQLPVDSGQRDAAAPQLSRDACMPPHRGAKLFALFEPASAIECANDRISP